MLKKIASNTISQVIAKAGTAFISIFLIKILTNYLDIAGYGLYSKIYNFLGIFAFLADLGLYTISIREISSDKKNATKVVSNIMTIRIILGILIIFLSTLTAYLLPGYNSDIAIISTIIVSFFTIVGLINSSILSVMQAFHKIEFSLFSTILGKLINLFSIILIVYVLYPKTNVTNFDIPFIFIMFSGLIGTIIMTYLNYLYARKICKIGLGLDWQYMKYIFKISIPYGIALFLSVVYFKVDVILLSILEPTDVADKNIALYSVPMKIIEVMMIVGTFFLNSMLPLLTKAFKEKDSKSIRSLINKSFKVLFGMGGVFIFLGILFRDNIISIIANPTYIDRSLYTYTSSDALIIVLFVLLFYFISSIFIYILIASEKQHRLLKINIIVAIINVIGNLLLIPIYSFIGAGIITVLSQIVLFILGYLNTKDIIKFDLLYKYIIKIILIGSIIFTIGNYFLNNFSLGIYLNVLIYGTILFSFYSFFIYRELKK